MITCVCASISLILQLSSQRTLRLSAVVQSQRLLQHYERKWWRGHNSDLLFVALLKCIYCLGINPVFVRAACAAAGLFPALSHLYEGCSERLSCWKVDPLKLKKKKNRHHHSKSQEHLQSLTSQPHRHPGLNTNAWSGFKTKLHLYTFSRAGFQLQFSLWFKYDTNR